MNKKTVTTIALFFIFIVLRGHADHDSSRTANINTRIFNVRRSTLSMPSSSQYDCSHFFVWANLYHLLSPNTVLLADSKSPSPKKNDYIFSEKEKRIIKMIGAKIMPNGLISIGKISINPRTKEISFPGRISLWEGPLEVLIATDRGRKYESLLSTDINPFTLQLALYLIGSDNGARTADSSIPQGDIFMIDVQPQYGKRIHVETWIYNNIKKYIMKRKGWVFVGSDYIKGACLAEAEGNVALIWSFGNTIIDNPEPTGDTDDIFIVNTPAIEKVAEKWQKKTKSDEVYIPVTIYIMPYHKHRPADRKKSGD